MPNFMRNLATGEIKTVEPDSKEFRKLQEQRDDNGRPLFEQTGGHDADPKTFASEYEVERRAEHDLPLPDVTTDGIAQSAKSAEKTGQDAPVAA